MNSLSSTKYHIEIESDPNNLSKVEEFVEGISNDIKADEDKVFGIMLAMSEAVTNAIMHANKSNPDKKVYIEITVNGKQMQIIVRDEGEGFEPSAVPDPTSPENLLKDSGRGLFLMNIYADKVEYNSTPKGTETILTFNI